MSGFTVNKLGSANNYSDKIKFNMLSTDWNVISHFHFVQEKMMTEDSRFINNRFPTLMKLKRTSKQYGHHPVYRMSVTKELKSS